MQLYTSIILFLTNVVLATPPECARDNCLRAVAGTRIPGHTISASKDCRTILQTTIAKATVTVYSNLTITKTIGKRATTTSATLPTYASDKCENLARYSSACSCFGITGGTITVGATTVTITRNATTTVSVTGGTTSPSPPTCTANVKTDPLNCGKCGYACPSGVCSNGVCSSEICNAQVCGGLTNCNSKNTECFCFSSADKTINKSTGNAQNIGFCGQNAACSGLTPCKTSDDCNVKNSTGNVCAVKTCCGESGICLVGQCSNPARKLMRMALGAPSTLTDTAAY